MIFVTCLLLVAQGAATSNSRWDYPDVFIEDSLDPYMSFAADYNYVTGDMFIACTFDSGYYLGENPGWVAFRSQDHGLNWESMYVCAFSATDLDQKDIDIVATRDDTLYVSLLFSSKNFEYDLIEYYKVYLGWRFFLGSEATYIAKFRSQKLVRDDFEPFYLYRAYIIDYEGVLDSIRLERSTDKGVSWDSLYYSYAAQYDDCDLTVSDSTVYFTYSYTPPVGVNEKVIRTRVYGNRGDAMSSYSDIHQTSDTINADIEYPKIGATTTQPDNGQLVYTVFSQRNTGTEQWDLLYKYSVDGGSNWSGTPDTLVKGSLSPVFCDIRGYEVIPNEYMDITYCVTSTSVSNVNYDNYFRWSAESEPTNWHDTTFVARITAGIATLPLRPELVYSPGASEPGAGVVYNSPGKLWFDAPWVSGIPESSDKIVNKIRSQIVFAGSTVKVGSAGTIVYDVTGKKIKELNSKEWNLTDEKGEEVKGGIYFIINKKTGEKIKLSILK
jgi:hypothetical protein